MRTILGPDPQDDVALYVRWHGHQGGHPVGPFCHVDEVTNYMTRRGLPRPDDVVMPSGTRGGVR